MINTVNDVDLDEALTDLQPQTPPPVVSQSSSSSKSKSHGVNDPARKAGIMIIDDESYNVLVVRIKVARCITRCVLGAVKCVVGRAS